MSDETGELYKKFKNAILQLADDIEVNPKKMEIGFNRSGKIFADIAILKKTLKIVAEGCHPSIDSNYLKTLCKGWQPFRNGATIIYNPLLIN